jgi:death-on-curing family protein
MMDKTRRITVNDVETIAHTLAKELLQWQEPIPDFGTRFPDRLEGCLAVPFYSFDNKVFYPTITGKAAVLFYAMVKNHPFQNGNKRIAMTTVLVFLFKNHKWLRVDNQELYNFAKWVAESNPRVKDATVSAIEKFISTYLIDRVD